MVRMVVLEEVWGTPPCLEGVDIPTLEFCPVPTGPAQPTSPSRRSGVLGNYNNNVLRAFWYPDGQMAEWLRRQTQDFVLEFIRILSAGAILLGSNPNLVIIFFLSLFSFRT